MSATTIAVLKKYMDERFGKIERALGTPIYGVVWDKGFSPTLVRTDDAIGMVANVGVDNQVVRNDFDYAPIFGEMHEATDILSNVLIRIPKFYIRKTDGPNFKTWQVSKVRYPGFYLPWCFWDFEKSIELPYIDVGKYNASLQDGRLCSTPGVPPLVNATIVNFRNYARANNDVGLKGCQQLDVHVYDVLQTLMYIEFATLNIQSIMQGFTSGRYGVEADLATVAEMGANRVIVSHATASQYRVGQTISIGTSRYGTNVIYGREIASIEDYDDNNKAILFGGEPVDISEGNFLMNSGAVSGFSRNIAASSGSIGDNSSGKYPCVYRGIENPFGSIWQFVDGININDNQAWVCADAEDYASNLFATPYEKLGYINADSNGYVKAMGFDRNHPFAELCVDPSGSSSTYYSDYYYQTTGQRVARVGGNWLSGSYAGPSYWPLNDSSSTANVSFGGRLLKKPL